MTTSTHAVPELPATTDRVLGALARHLPQHSMAELRLTCGWPASIPATCPSWRCSWSNTMTP